MLVHLPILIWTHPDILLFKLWKIKKYSNKITKLLQLKPNTTQSIGFILNYVSIKYKPTINNTVSR